jgi:hypothetical protein
MEKIINYFIVNFWNLWINSNENFSLFYSFIFVKPSSFEEISIVFSIPKVSSHSP